MDRALMQAIQTDAILALLTPSGEAGQHCKRELTAYKPGEEAFLRADYRRLECLIAALAGDSSLLSSLQEELSHVKWLPLTIAALNERTLLTHELYEIKAFTYHALRIRRLIAASALLSHFPLPDVQALFAYLDADWLNTPTFALSGAYDAGLKRVLERTWALSRQKQALQQARLQAASLACGMSFCSAEVVISRQDRQSISLLRESGYFTQKDENFANLTFVLQEDREMQRVSRELERLQAQLPALEERVRAKLTRRISKYQARLQAMLLSLSKLDWEVAKAVFALSYQAVIPSIQTKVALYIEGAVNLPVKLSQEQAGRRYQPLDLAMDGKVQVITGPNMGGKTTALLTAAQHCMLAALAIPLPAQRAAVCLFDHIWYNGVYSREENLSSFGREIVALSAAMRYKGRSLLLLDELARGTNPQEGEAILQAVLEHLQGCNVMVLAATHYDRPALVKGVRQYAIRGVPAEGLQQLTRENPGTLEEQLKLLNSLMDYNLIRLKRNELPPRNALRIAQSLGLAESIVQRAEALLQ